jgi:transglutaminase-like putative cysteine protease
MTPFLRSTPVVDWESPDVRDRAVQLARGRSDTAGVVQACFEWVRDRILHTSDHNLDPVTCSASEVLEQETGFCYAKSHLLAALLRANRIPAGFVYQRLRNDDGSYCLHGLNAVRLPDCGWYRLDARGSRAGLVSEFSPPEERLPFGCTAGGEKMFPGVWADPVAPVVDALRAYGRSVDLIKHLPDAEDLGLPDIVVVNAIDAPR